MKKFKPFLFVFYILFIVGITSCNNSESSDNNEDVDTNEVANTNETDVETFYLVPSPKDIFGFTEDSEFTFREELLNPLSNKDKYVSNIIKEFNFGIYSADLAYSAAFNRNIETVQYLTIVRTLSKEINIDGVFNESLAKRIENLTKNNRDSLISVSSDTYFDIIRHLEKNERISTLAFIAAGGWLESIYLVTQLTQFAEGSATIQRIADQKIIFSNLMLYLEQNQNLSSIQKVLDEFTAIQDVFNQLERIDVETLPRTENNEIIVVGGNTKIKITEEQFKKLKETISKVRNNFINTNVQNHHWSVLLD